MENRRWARIRELAASLDIPALGCLSPVELAEEAERHQRWIEGGCQAGMSWLSRPAPSRRHPGRLLPECRSIVVFGFPYSNSPGDGPWRISRFALGQDYHRVIGELLSTLLAELRRMEPGLDGRVAVDTSPLLEKALAVRAGIGWQGRHTCVIHPRYGSYLFLGELLLNRSLPVAPSPSAGSCGDCRRCLEACPTGALREPGILDARRCLAYLTIENRGVIPAEFHGRLGGNWFGCDICQAACPFNQVPADRPIRPEFRTDRRLQSLTPVTLADLSQKAFRKRFGFSSLPRATLGGLMRNTVALLPEAGPALSRAETIHLLDRFELAARQWREFDLDGADDESCPGAPD